MYEGGWRTSSLECEALPAEAACGTEGREEGGGGKGREGMGRGGGLRVEDAIVLLGGVIPPRRQNSNAGSLSYFLLDPIRIQVHDTTRRSLQ